MSKDVLQNLHGNALPRQIHVLLASLASLLPGIQDPKQPMRILHHSLGDFITGWALNMSETAKFYLDEKENSA